MFCSITETCDITGVTGLMTQSPKNGNARFYCLFQRTVGKRTSPASSCDFPVLSILL